MDITLCEAIEDLNRAATRLERAFRDLKEASDEVVLSMKSASIAAEVNALALKPYDFRVSRMIDAAN